LVSIRFFLFLWSGSQAQQDLAEARLAHQAVTWNLAGSNWIVVSRNCCCVAGSGPMIAYLLANVNSKIQAWGSRSLQSSCVPGGIATFLNTNTLDNHFHKCYDRENKFHFLSEITDEQPDLP
jgi:hypothetical protein